MAPSHGLGGPGWTAPPSSCSGRTASGTAPGHLADGERSTINVCFNLIGLDVYYFTFCAIARDSILSLKTIGEMS